MKVILADGDAAKELNKIYTACRTCYNAGSPIDMYEDVDNIDEEKKVKLIKQVVSTGHHSVIEHINITFFIDGISRALTHQLVRHRLASYSQQSQRYVEFKGGNFDFVYPQTVLATRGAVEVFDECIEKISKAYADLIELGVPAEDARALLPNACCTNISVTMNLRSFIHFCNERMCTCAQAEIRKLAREMAKLASERYPYFKEFFAPKCETLGYCNEMPRRSCGRKPLVKDVLSSYKRLKEAEEELMKLKADASWQQYPETMGQ